MIMLSNIGGMSTGRVHDQSPCIVTVTVTVFGRIRKPVEL